MLVIDGSMGEGGGQVLRTSLALSLVTGAPFRLVRVRAGRARPGLLAQHLTALRAAAGVGDAEVEGDTLGSPEVTFRPRRLRGGEHRFAVGTAGSAMLVLQTVVPALALAAQPSTIVFEGGTHNPQSPPFEAIRRAYLPLLARMGARVDAVLERPGFYPAGGGRVVAAIEPVRALAPLTLIERGDVQAIAIVATVSSLPRTIAERELAAIAARGGPLAAATGRVDVVSEPRGPGNVVTIEIASRHVTEVFTGFGERGVRAEDVAAGAAGEAEAYLAADVPVGEHLCDQLLLLLALAGGGALRTVALSRHATTQLDLIPRFLPDVRVLTRQTDELSWLVELSGPQAVQSSGTACPSRPPTP